MLLLSLLQTFQGNRDRLSVKTHPINPPVFGRYVRIVPRGWRSHISMRLELYGCPWSKLLALSAAKIAKVFSFDFFLEFQFSKEINCLVARQIFPAFISCSSGKRNVRLARN